MTRPTPRKIPIQSPIRDLRVELSRDKTHWMIWQSANKDFTCGTFLALHFDGSMVRVTWHPDGSETHMEIER